MKKPAKPKGPRHLDKQLFEAGQQCHKRLWLDFHEPVAETATASRDEMSRVGDELRELARTAFPKGVAVESDDIEQAAVRTAELLDEGTPVLFDAAFVADGVEVVCDVLVVHKDGEVDLFEIKSGTKVKHRYVNDLALQAVVLQHCGRKLRRAYLLHVNSKYAHTAGEEYPPMQLLRSADVTAKVQKQIENVGRRLQQFRLALQNESVLELPMGTFCTSPFPCPHFARCRKEAPELPLFELPELSRVFEIELHKEGIEDLTALDPERQGLNFRQRRTLTSLRKGQRIVEPFVAEELRECTAPQHFVAIAALTEPLPRFDKQRPWQLTPYGWAAVTIHEDGRVETASHVHADRDDPRESFARTLARHVEVGGTIFCWGDESIREMRDLLDALPDQKPAVRALLGHPHLDMLLLFEAGVFDPELRDLKDLRQVVSVLLGDTSGNDLDALDLELRQEALQKARAPRVRAATREKIAADIAAALAWQAERLRQLFELFAGVETKAALAKAGAQPEAPQRGTKPLPKLPE